MKPAPAWLAALWPMVFLASAMGDDGASGQGQAVTSELQSPAVSVVTTKVVNAGDHQITFVRILPPVLPRIPPPATPPPTAADEALARERAGKSFIMVSFAAVIFPGPVTELSWQHAGRTYHAYSNVDFRLLSNVPEIETATAVCSLFFNPALADPATATTTAERLAARAALSPNHAQWVLANPATVLDPDDPTPQALAALLAHYDQNQAALQADYARRQAEQAKHELQARAQPTPPPNSTVFFWPIKSRQNPP